MDQLLNSLSKLNITDCHSIAQLSDNITLQCQLIHVIQDCTEDSFIDYADIAFCTIQSKFLTLLLFGTVLAFLFLAISITADDFLCPLLVSISKSLNLSDNVAGVTFLAIGNGAPDIFSSISGISKNDASLVIRQLYGGGIFVTAIVIGSILIREQFHIMHRPLLRDVFFYLITTTLVYITFLSGTLTLYHSLAFIVIYLVYVCVVILSGVIYRRNERTKALNDIAQEQNMPGEGVMARKYQIGGLEKRQETLSKLSLKSLYVSGPGDDFEGVTLRRIKFRKYPLEPTTTPCSYNVCKNSAAATHHVTSQLDVPNHYHHRRLTVYHIGEAIGGDGHAICEVPAGSDNHNNNNIVCTALHYNDSRRLTISDTEFPAQHRTVWNTSLPTPGGRRLTEYESANTVMSRQQHPNKQNLKQNNPTKVEKNGKFRFSIAKLWNSLCSKTKRLLFHTEPEDNDYGNGNPNGSQKELDGSESGSENNGNNNSNLQKTRIEWQSFVLQICQVHEWKQSRSIMRKLLILVKAPIYLIFNLTIPVVDRDLELAGWNRPLILLNILLGPQCFLLITKVEFNLFPSLQLHLVALGVSLLLVPLVVVTSRLEAAPSYHIVFAYVGFTISVAWIYTIANEVVSLLKAVGIVFQISQFLLGLTFLAWGNSLGDLISNLSMAKNGFPRMAISACLGGPVLNMLLGMGIPYTAALMIKEKPSSIQISGSGNSAMVTIMFAAIVCSLLLTAGMLVCVTKFAASKTHGIMLYILYAGFIIVSIYAEYLTNK